MDVAKVAAFITRDIDRDGAPVRQLLVFRHANPRAGIQVPAGTVEPGEAISAAVLREAAEETGLHDLAILGQPVLAPLELGDDEWYLRLNDGGRETLQRLDLAHPRVRITGEQDGRIHLAGISADGSPVEWWADRSTVTRDVRRWLFHLRLTRAAPDHWQRAFDAPEAWAFSWVDLDEDPRLIGAQAGWLRLMRPRLRR